MAVLEVKNLTFTYAPKTQQKKIAVNDVSLSIEKGDFVGIIGHTGSGKSTLVQLLNGLLKPTSGEVLFNGKSIWAEPKKIRNIRFKVGLVFQYPEYQLFEETVEKDIAFGPRNMGLSEEEIAERVVHAAAFVGLKPSLLQKSPFELSGGEKRRAAIAGVVAMDPEVLILDEPSAGLDPMGRDELLEQIRTYHEQRQNTVLLVSHSMEDVAKFAKKVLVMADGQKKLYDTTNAVFAHSEELEALSLKIPQITKIMYLLRQAGVDVDPNALTVEQGFNSIQKLLQKSG